MKLNFNYISTYINLKLYQFKNFYREGNIVDWSPQDGAVEALVEAKLQSRFLFLSANVVNHPLLSSVHARLGALLPFTPTVEHWCTSDDVAACAAANRERSCSGSDCDWHLVRDTDGEAASLDGSPAGNAT